MVRQGGASATTPTTGQTDAVIGNSMHFNGSTDMIGEDILTAPTVTQGSVSMWVKPEATGASSGNPFGGVGFQSYWVQNGQWAPTYPTNSFNVGSLYSNANVYTMNDWNHWVITIDSSTSNNETTVYIDGQVVPMFNYPSGTGGGSSNNQNSKTAQNLLTSVIIGGQYNSSPQFKYPFEGKIDEFSTWNKVLSASEVATLYNNGNGNIPATINSNNNLLTYLSMDDTSFPISNEASDSFTVVMDNYTTHLDGMIDEMFINSDVLTASEISDIDRRGETVSPVTTSSTSFNDGTVANSNNRYVLVSPTEASGTDPTLTVVADGTTYSLVATEDLAPRGDNGSGCASPSSGSILDSTSEWFAVTVYPTTTYNKCVRGMAEFDISYGKYFQ